VNNNSMVIALSEPQTQFGREDSVSPSFPQKAFPAIRVVESEVNHDGFSQYFSNRSAETAPLSQHAEELGPCRNRMPHRSQSN
jgi:hypothetical protein